MFIEIARKDMCDKFTLLLNRSIIRPLHKSGSLYDIDNYRGITLSSNVYKIFSKTMESTAVNDLESNNILG